MAIQRRQMRFNPQLGSGGQPIQQSQDVSASADNAAAAQRQQDWNSAAAQQYQMLRQAQFQQQDQINLTKVSTDANRQLLAQALGYDPKNSPPFSSLYTKFISLPTNVQVGLYKQGAVPWLDSPDSDKSGEDLIDEAKKNLQNHLDAHTNAVVDEFTKGNLVYNKDAQGNVNWQQKISEPNPAGPMLPPIEKYVPANPAIVAYLQRAINQGYMADPSTGKFPQDFLPNVPAPKMNTDQFMQVLAARQGQPDAVDKFQQVLNQRANPNAIATQPFVNTDAQSNMSLTPYNYGSNMSLTPYIYQNPLQLSNAKTPTTPTLTQSSSPVASDANDPFVKAHNYLVSPQTSQNLSDTLSNVSNITEDTAKGSLATFLNIYPQMINAAKRLIGGSGGGDLGQTPLTPNPNAQPALDPIVAAIRARQQQEQQVGTSFSDVMGP